MPVVIHEIEVTPRAQGAASKAPSFEAPAPTTAPVGARDVFRIEREIRQRQLRLWAH